jgi:hypothetical protein
MKVGSSFILVTGQLYMAAIVVGPENLCKYPSYIDTASKKEK